MNRIRLYSRLCRTSSSLLSPPIRAQTKHDVQRCMTSGLSNPELDSEWSEMAEKQLKKTRPVDSLLWHTAEGVTVKPVYTAVDTTSLHSSENSFLPGKYPYTRGQSFVLFASSARLPQTGCLQFRLPLQENLLCPSEMDSRNY